MAAILHVFFRFCLIFMVYFSSAYAINARDLSEIFHPYTMSAQFYLDEADKSDELRSVNMRLLAAGRMLHDKQLTKALVVLQSIQTSTRVQDAILQVLWGKYHYMLGNPQETIRVLAKAQDIEQLDIYYQCEYHELLALAYEENHQYSEACLQRIKLDALLAEHQSQTSNRQHILQILQNMSKAELDTQYLEAAEGSEWKAWLEFTRIKQNPNSSESLMKWQKKYPKHPALSVLPRDHSQKPTLAPAPAKKARSFFSFFNFSREIEIEKINQIALLLPMTGQLAGPGEAIKDGFMDAYRKKNSSIPVRVYDTNQGGALHQYHQAIQDGASIVVGPLTKNDVQAVGSTFSSTPTLLLNDYSGSLSRYKYAIGFSPKDEAAQLADIMAQKSYKRVMMIAPSNPWGQEIAKTYVSEASRNRMTVVSTVYYTSNNSLSQMIRSGIGYSEYKEKTPNGREKVHGSRRQDIDAIFLVAYPSTARQVLPLLKYYYAGDIPTYAISAAYDAFYNPSQNKDLNSLYFIDIPWVFTHQLAHRAWPETWNTYSRLYALGYDSFGLTQEWATLQSLPESGISKQTGVLYVMSNGHIRRQLRLGQIYQGVAREQ
jgi:outer membrane PBP1 activator LpoA protein